MDDKELFTAFTKQLEVWSDSGKEPELGDWNIRAYLDMQEQRLRSKNLKRTFRFKIKGQVYKVGDYVVGMLLNAYNRRVNFANGSKKIEYYKDDKKIFSEKIEVPLYQLIKWPASENEEWKKETYVCPNCGNIEKLEKLESAGCEYCGTHFMMSELYPKVTNFYTLENGEEKGLSPVRVGKLLLGSLIVALLLTIAILNMETGTEQTYGLVYTFPVAYIGSFLLSIWFSPVIFQIAESIPVSIGVAGAKGRITGKLRRYDPAFSYDYFEGRALSLLRMIVYAENPLEYIQYAGKELSPSFQDIVDMEYRGGIGVKKICQVGDYLEVTLKVFMKNTYYIKKKCRKKKDTMILRMRHNIKWQVEPDFSIVKVSCHGCNGSFDATKYRNCPYCGNEYDAGIDDWTVLEIK